MRKSLGCAIAMAALVIGVRGGVAASVTSAPVATKPIALPTVFEFQLNRTSEPLSLFNELPPPVPLSSVRRLKGERAAAGPSLEVREIGDSSLRAGTQPLITALRPGRSSSGQTTSASLAKLSPPRFREYPDTLVLANGSSLSCKVLGDVGAALRIELSNGVVVNMPKHRIARVTKKASSR